MISATRLRQNLYQILDSVLETGLPVEIERGGQILKIISVEPPSKWERLEAHDIFTADPESLVDIDWANEWKPDVVS